ncbi:hypothetical protein [Flexivirga caeni]|uniref:PEGA domain-containing protein n=1 Tax=Flexivirga caeni TaxID=2294115 RepID=A0A3M9M4N1_9MICO|nr:hypothetical protein [Flexivirga caeni]RNI20456.1 hypothetical protein EFY87_14590 [Flexivirga caeni]
MTHPGDPANQPQQPTGTPLPGQWQGAPGQWQGAPPPQQPRGGAGGLLLLTLQGSPLTASMLTPKVFIDGFPVGAAYGLNTIPVPPGRHTVRAEATWIVKYGQASYDFDAQPGQQVEVFYASPMIQFMKGRMGPVKQKRPGVWLLVVILVIVVVIVVVS